MCAANGAGSAREVFVAGKGNHSQCICANGTKLPSTEGNVVSAATFLVPFSSLFVMLGIVVLVMKKRGISAPRDRSD